jgi:predicted nucleotidyltransferase
VKRSTPHWDVAVRDALRRRVADALASEATIARVELHGSLASGNSDIYSDIDLAVHLHPAVTDRECFVKLPTLMNSVGPRLIDGLGFAALPGYVGTFYFEGVPLFWQVDIGVIPAAATWHVDSTDLLTAKRPEQRFKMWIKAMKLFVRAEHKPGNTEARSALNDYLADIKERVAKRMDTSPVTGSPRDQLNMLLDMEIAWHRERGIVDARVFEACEALRSDVLT